MKIRISCSPYNDKKIKTHYTSAGLILQFKTLKKEYKYFLTIKAKSSPSATYILNCVLNYSVDKNECTHLLIACTMCHDGGTLKSDVFWVC